MQPRGARVLRPRSAARRTERTQWLLSSNCCFVKRPTPLDPLKTAKDR